MKKICIIIFSALITIQLDKNGDNVLCDETIHNVQWLQSGITRIILWRGAGVFSEIFLLWNPLQT